MPAQELIVIIAAAFGLAVALWSSLGGDRPPLWGSAAMCVGFSAFWLLRRSPLPESLSFLALGFAVIASFYQVGVDRRFRKQRRD